MMMEKWERSRTGTIIAAFAMVILSGCGATVPPGIEPVDYTAAARDLVPLVSAPGGFAVQVDPGGHLNNREHARLNAFIADFAGNRPESLRIALYGRVSPAQFRTVADALVADGVDPSNIVRAPDSSIPSRPREIAIGVERAVAVLPPCPGWTDHISAPEDNRNSPNFGCSDVSNFAAMVSDPHHLVRAASSIYRDGERAAIAVTAYRSDKIFDKWDRELPKPGTFNVVRSQ